MRRAAKGITHTKIDIGFTEVDRVELTMKVSAMKNTHIAAFRDFVKVFRKNAGSGILSTG